MFAFADVVADGASDGGFFDRRVFLDEQAGHAEDAIDGVGGEGAEELAFGVGPGVFESGVDVYRPGGDEGDQHVLIDGDCVLFVVVLFEVAGEPVGEGSIYAGGGFAELAAGEGGAAFAAVVGDDDGEAFVLGASPEGCFADAGMAVEDDFGRVDFLLFFEDVHGAGKTPGPGAEGAPFVCLRGAGEEGVDAVFEAVVEVGIDVAVIGGDDGVAAFEDHVDGPAAGAFAAILIGGDVAFGADPGFGNADFWVGLDGVVAVEVEAEEGGDAAFDVVGEIDEEVHGGGVGIGAEPDSDLFAGGEAVVGGFIDFEEFGAEFDFGFGGLAVDLFGEEFEDFGAALFAPGGGVFDGGAVGEDERVGEGVGGDFRFVVVKAGLLGGEGEGEEEQEAAHGP